MSLIHALRPIPAGVALLALCGFGSSAGAFDLLQYFPTQQGAKWEYRYSESSTEGGCIGTRLVSVGSESFDQATLVTTAPEADKCSGTRPFPEFAGSTDTYNTNIVAYRLVARAATDANRSSVRWVMPLLFMPTFSNVFQTFSSAGTVIEARGEEQVRSASYSATVKVVGLEDVTVPAGTFKSTVHLQLIERRTYKTQQQPPTRIVERTDRWLARGVGVVRVRVEVVLNGERQANSQLQLVNADVPGLPPELQDQTAPVPPAR